MKSKTKKKVITVSPQNIQKKIEAFEKNNPEISKAMKLFDLSMSHYEQSLKSLEPVKTYTSSSTKVLQ